MSEIKKQVSQTYEERAIKWINELKPDEYVKHLFQKCKKEQIEVTLTGTHPSDPGISKEEANRRTMIDIEEKLGVIMKMDDTKIVYSPYIKEGDPMEVREDIKEAVIRFAHTLDKFNGFSKDMEILALHKAREIDREFMLALIEEVGSEKGKEIAQRITAGHAHTTPDQLQVHEDIDAVIAEGIQEAAKEEEKPLNTTLG